MKEKRYKVNITAGLRSGMLRNSRSLLLLLAFLLSAASCNFDNYESGDGELSYMHADYADITVKDGIVTSIVTDDDASLAVPPSLSYGGANANDTVIRRLLYYNKVNDTDPIQVIGQKTVSVIQPVHIDVIGEMKTDPVVLTSAWLSANRKYVNMHLGIKCGTSDASAKQRLLPVVTSVSDAGMGSVSLTLYHDQADMQEYYTQEVYVSIPATMLSDIINLTVNTYSGITTRTLVK